MTTFNCQQIIKKRVAESFYAQMNFARRMPEGWEISSATCTGPTGLTIGTPVIAGTLVKFRLSSGQTTKPGHKDALTVTIVAHDPEAGDTATDETLCGVGQIVVE